MNDELTLRINGMNLQGWTQVRVTRGVERTPSDFDIVMTERFPGKLPDLSVIPGQSCEILLGSDVVITGYVDRFIPSMGPQEHTVRVMGRGKCCDLVDCSAEWPGAQISGTSAWDVAQKFAQPYGITVLLANGVSGGPIIPQFNLILGETGWDLIERICRYAALLPYELANGFLLLNQVGTVSHASGFAQGKNVQHATMQYGVDQRYSNYVSFLQSVETLSDLAPGGVDPNVIANVVDPTMTRHRQLDIIAEAASGGVAIAQARAKWEKARRWGRSFVCTLTADSWRDSAGQLWQPNQLAWLDLPMLKTAGVQWTISEVTFKLDAQGTTAELTLMPPEAFDPQPVLLQPIWQMGASFDGTHQLLDSSGFLSVQTLGNQAVSNAP